jgi:hypothetical protein
MRFTDSIATKFATVVFTIHVCENDQSIEEIKFSLNELLWL